MKMILECSDHIDIFRLVLDIQKRRKFDLNNLKDLKYNARKKSKRNDIPIKKITMNYIELNARLT